MFCILRYFRITQQIWHCQFFTLVIYRKLFLKYVRTALHLIKSLIVFFPNNRFSENYFRTGRRKVRWLLSAIRFRVLFFKTLGRFALEPKCFLGKLEVQFWLKKVPLFCANKAVLSVLSKERRFLTKRRESLLYQKIVTFIICVKNGNHAVTDLVVANLVRSGSAPKTVGQNL